MDDLVQRLRLLGNFGHDNHSTAHDAADAIERLTAERDSLSLAHKTSEDDVFNLTQKVIPNLRAERDALQAKLDAVAESKTAAEAIRNAVAQEKLDALQEELELRRKSGSASDRLHNLCKGIAEDADGSEWSREEWERVDAETVSLKNELRALQSKLDALMLEYCPDEMTKEQIAEWAKHQRPGPESLQQRINTLTKCRPDEMTDDAEKERWGKL